MIEYVTKDEQIPELFELLMQFHGEQGIAPMNVQKTLASIHDIVHNHVCIVARVEGKLVGSLAFAEVPLWYADIAAVLVDRWFYVVPEHRGRIVVWRSLMEAAQAVARDLQMPLYISPNHSPRREPRTEIERVGVALRFDPLGSRLLVR